MGSIANIDQHEVVFPVAPNTLYFVRETNSPFIPWLLKHSLKVNSPKMDKKLAIVSIAILISIKLSFH